MKVEAKTALPAFKPVEVTISVMSLLQLKALHNMATLPLTVSNAVRDAMLKEGVDPKFALEVNAELQAMLNNLNRALNSALAEQS